MHAKFEHEQKLMQREIKKENRLNLGGINVKEK